MNNGDVVLVHEAAPADVLAKLEAIPQTAPGGLADIAPDTATVAAAMSVVQNHAHRFASLLAPYRAQWQAGAMRICRSNVYWLFPGWRTVGRGNTDWHCDSPIEPVPLYVNLYAGEFEGGEFVIRGVSDPYPVRRGSLFAGDLARLPHRPLEVMSGARLYFGMFIEPATEQGERYPGAQTLRWPFAD